MARCLHGQGSTDQCGGPAVSGSAFCLLHRPHGTAEPSAQPAAGAATADPNLVAARMAQLMVIQETVERRKLARAGKPRRNDDGTREADLPRAAFRVIPRRQRPDATEAIDPTTGKYPASIPTGWTLRRVRLRDHENRPTQARVSEFEGYGYVPVTDANGEPIEDRLGLLMMAPPEAKAERTRDKTPPGANLRDDAFDAAMDIEGDINRIAGQGAASVVTEADHGRRRTLEGPGSIELRE